MLNLLERETGAAAYAFGRVAQMGWVGVQLFFVLSGFLITGILLDSRRAGNYFRGFYARRALRILPLYFAVLTVAFVVLPMIGILPPLIAADRPHQWWLWLYLSNWASLLGEGSKAFPHFWSLAVEEQFYLVWPWLILSRTPDQCIRLCVGIALTSLVLRCGLAWKGAASDLIYENSLCRMDALVLGGAAAAALRSSSWSQSLFKMRKSLLAWSIGTALLGAGLTRGFWTGTVAGETIGYTFASVMFVLLLLAVACADIAGTSHWASAFRARPLRSIGKYSYAMYVLHKPMHDYLGKPLVAALKLDLSRSVPGSVAYIIVGILVTFAAAVASWHLFEKHFLRMKRFFAPKYERGGVPPTDRMSAGGA
jgi:peptidoglycan/LPS O-acetylase OafA/YrhL